jgi:DNA-binding CsgD family transcriptional regulator
MSRRVLLAMFDNCSVRRTVLVQELHKNGRYHVLFHREADPGIAATLSFTEEVDGVLLAVGENAQNEQEMIDVLRSILGNRPVLAYALQSIYHGFFQRFLQQRRMGMGYAHCLQQACFVPYVDADFFVRALDYQLFGMLPDGASEGVLPANSAPAPVDFPPRERQLSVREVAARPAVSYELSPRENQILRLLGDGQAFKAIAAELGISINTVYTHAKRIRAKFHLTGNAQLLSLAIQMKFSAVSTNHVV